MLTNYFITALRNFLRSKAFSLISMVGLSAGMAASLLILYFVSFESSYDKFHKHARDIYRIELDTYRDGMLESKSALTSPAVAVSLASNFPDIEEFARIATNPGKALLLIDGKRIKEEKAFIADSSIFRVFDFDFLNGSSKNLFTGPYELIVSETLAEKLFGKNWTSQTLDQSIEVRSDGINGNFKLKGIFKSFPANSHFHPELIVPKNFLNELVGEQAADDSWNFNFFYSYIRLKPGTEPGILREDFNTYVAETRKEALKAVNASFDFRFQPIADIHLKSNVEFELESVGSMNMVHALEMTGIIVLAIAWINFINLSTARGIRRAREVGVRKVLGAGRKQLIFQFVTEALLMNGLALLFALLVVRLGQTFFAEMIGVPIQFIDPSFLTTNLGLLIAVLAILITGILLSGFYPAFVLSSYNPIEALKSNVLKPRGIHFRKALMVTQSAISLIMISGTFIVSEQINYMRSKDLGIDIEKTLVVETPEMLDNTNKSAANVFKSNTQNLPFVEGFSMSSVVPGQEVTFRSYNLSNIRTKSTINCGIIGVDNDFFRNFDLRLIAGGTFSERDSSGLGVIVNEEVVTQLGFASAAESIGASILHSNKGNTTEFVIEGVVSNYHQRSLQRSFEPILFTKGTDIKFYSIKFEPHGFSDLKRNLALIEYEFKKIFPDDAFHFFFLDQNFENLYRSEVRLGSTLFSFSLLVILISALGLLSLSTFMITLRAKEIGIRKVMGASTLSITNLFLRDYFHLLAISALIGTPVSYFVSTHWLSNFAFKIEVSPLLLAIPIVFLSTIILFAVGFQSVRAALRNPADIIKSE